MPIAKRPIQVIKKNSESEINEVINKGGSVAKPQKNQKNKKILVRIPIDLLERVDEDLASLPLKTPRNTWMLEAILEKLNRKKNKF